MRILCGDESHEVEMRSVAGGWEAVVNGAKVQLDVDEVAPGTFLVRQGMRRETFHCVREGDVVHLFWRGVVHRLEEESEATRSAHRHVPQGLEAPMPGKVIAVKVAPGQAVAKGEELLVVEAMKMENAIRAPREGRVKVVSAEVGQMVSPGVVLVELE
jgi:acetyl/propionyl-CoA carboxylase alpha subunit